MIIRKYGIILRRLTYKDIELVRQKRNQDSVRKYMFYDKLISPEEQERWFYSINNINNYYFIIEYNGKKVGLINGKNVDYKARTSEGGIFIWDEDQRNSYVSVIASVIMAEITFRVLELEKTFAQVLVSNEAQVNYNRFMGYEPLEESQKGKKSVYVLTRDNYFKKGKKVLNAVIKISKDNTPISRQDMDFSEVGKKEYESLYKNFPDDIQKVINQYLPVEH